MIFFCTSAGSPASPRQRMSLRRRAHIAACLRQAVPVFLLTLFHIIFINFYTFILKFTIQM